MPRPPADEKASDAKRGGLDLRQLLGREQASEGNLLPADRAFVLMAASDSPDRITLHWEIADGYYLYRDKVKVTVASGDATLGKTSIPGGKVKNDEYFGDQVVFFDSMDALVPVAAGAGTREIALEVGYQGCAEVGLCYPPIHKTLRVALAAPGSAVTASPRHWRHGSDAVRSGRTRRQDPQWQPACSARDILRCRAAAVVHALRAADGADPVRHHRRRRRDSPCRRGRGFALSLTYVLGMALTYTVAGAAFAAAGGQVQAVLPAAVDHRSVCRAVRPAGTRDVRRVQAADAGRIPERVRGLSNRQKQGTFAGTAVMGALSALIVTTCVAPPLVAALAVIGQTGDVFRGGAALFALSLGMGAPLLLVGASAGRLLPKAGPWMDAVKSAFGVMMLGVAMWMLGRILPGPADARALGRAGVHHRVLPGHDGGARREARDRRGSPWASAYWHCCTAR